jgi:hypothetical protein
MTTPDEILRPLDGAWPKGTWLQRRLALLRLAEAERTLTEDCDMVTFKLLEGPRI